MSRIWKRQFFVSTFRGVRRVQFFMGTPNRFFTNSREIVIGRIQKLDFCAIVLGYTHCCYHLHSAPKDRISHNMFLSTFCTQTADIGYIQKILWGWVSLCQLWLWGEVGQGESVYQLAGGWERKEAWTRNWFQLWAESFKITKNITNTC